MANVVNDVNDKVYNALDKTLEFLQGNLNTINRGSLPQNLINTYGKITALERDLTQMPLPLLEDTISDAIDWIREYKLSSGKKYSRPRLDMLKVAEAILFQAQMYCPVMTGALRDSGYIDKIGNTIVVGFSSPYAVYVHENLAIKHPIHAHGRNCGGRAKFLEIAATEILGKSVPIRVGRLADGIYIEVS